MPETPASGAERVAVLGRIVGIFGVRGFVKVESWTRPRAAILGYRQWRLRLPGLERSVTLAEGHAQEKGTVIARIDGCVDRDAAASLVGFEIAVPVGALPEAKPGEYYWADLEGLEVVTEQGAAFGRVNHLFETGANDVMVVRDGARERLIPFTRDVVRSVDLAARRIVVDWDADF